MTGEKWLNLTADMADYKLGIPWSFEYRQDNYKIRVLILEKFKHYYTRKSMYRVRRDCEAGWILEDVHDENDILYWLKSKVED